MGLDARVHCDCFENGLISDAPPFADKVRLSEEGRPEIYIDDLSSQMIFEEWAHSEPCPHGNFVVVRQRIGNIAMVGFLWERLVDLEETSQKTFPVLREKVLYSGTHCGDMLTVADVELLRAEVDDLRTILNFDRSMDAALIDFCDKMSSLIVAATELNKPIVF